MTSETLPGTLRGYVLARRPDSTPTADDMRIVETPTPELDAGHILVRNRWLSIDASLRLRMTPSPSPYLTPYDVGGALDGWAVGDVVWSESARYPVGSTVVHYGGWRDYAHLDATLEGWTAPRIVSISPTRPANVYLGALGPNGLTSWAGLTQAAGLRDGDVVFVSAAAGSVGMLAVQIARLRGHRVIGSAGSPSKVRYLVDELGADAAFDYRTETPTDALARLAPDGIDVYFDNVGGAQLDAALNSMRPGGRIALCGAIADYNASEDERVGIKHLFKATERGLNLRGFLARMYADHWAQFESEVAAYLDAGRLVYPETVTDGLDSAHDAFLGLLSGTNIGKTLVRL